MTSLQYFGALTDAAELEAALGDATTAARDQFRANHVREALKKQCWNSQLGLLADNPDQKIYSQQANILAVLYDIVPKDQQQTVLGKILKIEPGTTPGGVLSASYYFRYYLARALQHAGMADLYLQSLDPWRKLLPLHFSTWPEIPGDTRSDSHAWSAHPIYDMLTLVAGIEPESPGFATVRVAPHLGSLDHLSATFPHPQGEIRVEYRSASLKTNPPANGEAAFHAVITLPGTLTGHFQFHGQIRPLKPGENRIDIPLH
jgi:hypothetical protein